MNIKIKKLHKDAVLPKKANDTDAGYDLVAISGPFVSPEGFIEYRTGLAVAPPEGYHLEIVPRSSISKYDLALANSIGVIDNSYRGELIVRFKPTAAAYDSSHMGCFNRLPGCGTVYKVGDRIAQLIIRKTESMNLVEVEELDSTARGAGGFGSTGK